VLRVKRVQLLGLGLDRFFVSSAQRFPEFLDVQFADVARAFGAHGERVTSADQFIPALRRAEESGKPAIVDVVVSRELPPPVTRYEAAGLRKI